MSHNQFTFDSWCIDTFIRTELSWKVNTHRNNSVFNLISMDVAAAGPSGVRAMTRRWLFMKMQQQDLPNINEKLKYIENYLLTSENYTDVQIKNIKHNYSRFKYEMKRRWSLARNREELLLSQNSTWLDGTISLPKIVARSSGRPPKPFTELSQRSKRRRTEKICSPTSLDVLTHATQSQLRTRGKRDASEVLGAIVSTPKRASKYKQAFSIGQKNIFSKLTPTAALAIFVEADLSRKYEIIRHSHRKLYPCYSLLQAEKQKCYPSKNAYRVTETSAEVNLQDLMDHTANRLLSFLANVLERVSDADGNEMILFCKWGCDGSQQAQYKQKFENIEDSDANIFQSSFVPLQLQVSTNKKVLWNNPIPSSPWYCRPIRIKFVKESNDVTTQEIQFVQNSISTLRDTRVFVANRTFSVKCHFMLTMIDGKVCNAATQTTSTMRCYICGNTSKEFNDLTVQRDVKKESVQFGMSILHGRIRVFETILHLSYKLPIKKWQVRSAKDKAIVKSRKLKMQQEFRSKLGLIVDVPKPGFGSTNDGNTSRRFFTIPDVAAEITGIDLRLIYRLKVILEAISCGHKLDSEKFDKYAIDTAQLYVQLYNWYPMSPTLHKLLVHGAIIIEEAVLPIGMLSEEAAEARNKHFRSYRTKFARKCSRTACNMDVLNHLLLTSDPVITGMRPRQRKQSKPFLPETREMLLAADPDENISSDDDSSDLPGVEREDPSDEEPWNSSSFC